MEEKLQNYNNNDNIESELSSEEGITSITDVKMLSMVPMAQKRSLMSNGIDHNEPPAKKKILAFDARTQLKWNSQMMLKAASAVVAGGKNPVSALNELGLKVNYSIIRQNGPAHCPSFIISVSVADMTFQGWGHSKKAARASAARRCLASLLSRAGRAPPELESLQDFTSDDPPSFALTDFQYLEPPGTSAPSTSNAGNAIVQNPQSSRMIPMAITPSANMYDITQSNPTSKSPINLLYETYPGVTFTCTFGDGSPLSYLQVPVPMNHNMRFKVVCKVKNQQFVGYGSSKKLAKLAAAKSALDTLKDNRRVGQAIGFTLDGFLHPILADHIGKLINNKFNEMMKNDMLHAKRKVLAGIVMTINNQVDTAKVIAVSTGTKCISGEHLSVSGRAVNDCHAEVVARRCLQRFIYSQLYIYAAQEDPTKPIADLDLEPCEGGGYQMKGNRQFHLYVSTAPCGDGRIFSPHESHDSGPDRHPNRLARGQLRTKIESGEGTIPVKNCENFSQTWDGVLQGERLLTMSCSDKVARWCCVGLQGTLLSCFIKPIYLNSLVLGSLFHPHHLYRAVCGRIQNSVQSLPPPFMLHRPMMGRATSLESRSSAKAPSFSASWCSSSANVEIVNAVTGKLECGQPSLLCKQSMFARWQYLVKRLPIMPMHCDEVDEIPELPQDLRNMFYNEAKQLCPTYQLAKERLFKAFEKGKLGRWIKKPVEQDQFICEDVPFAHVTTLFT